MDYKVYYLVCPESREVRYVGVTKQKLQRRLHSHINESFCKTRSNRTHKNNWIQTLHRKGLKPEINLLQAFNNQEDLLAAEIYWIGYFKSIGCDLTNSCSGGKGTLNPSEETRLKMREAKIGKPSLKKGKKTGLPAWNRGQKASPEAIEKMKQRTVSPETRKKLSEALKGKPTWLSKNGLSPESIEKMRQSKLGKPSPLKKAILCTTVNTVFESIVEASKALNVQRSNIFKVLTGERKSTKGYHFQYYTQQQEAS